MYSLCLLHMPVLPYVLLRKYNNMQCKFSALHSERSVIFYISVLSQSGTVNSSLPGPFMLPGHSRVEVKINTGLND
jgi:hypothetical protein